MIFVIFNIVRGFWTWMWKNLVPWPDQTENEIRNLKFDKRRQRACASIRSRTFVSRSARIVDRAQGPRQRPSMPWTPEPWVSQNIRRTTRPALLQLVGRATNLRYTFLQMPMTAHRLINVPILITTSLHNYI